jgi:hypothetical protein
VVAILSMVVANLGTILIVDVITIFGGVESLFYFTGKSLTRGDVIRLTPFLLTRII